MRKYKTPAETKDLGLMTKTELKVLKLMPGNSQMPAAEVWQGQGTYSVWSLDGCVPYRRGPGPSELRRRAVRDLARKILAADPVILDTETTGLDGDAEIIELGIVDSRGEVLFDSLICPMGSVSPEAEAIHGIGAKLLAGKPTWRDVHEQVASLIAGRTVVMYGASFDSRMLRQTAEAAGLALPVYQSECLMLHYAQWWGEQSIRRPGCKWQKLSAAAEQCGYVPAITHRAVDDCLSTLAVLKYVAKGRYRKRAPLI